MKGSRLSRQPSRWRAGLVLIGGSAGYAGLVAAAGVTFYITPLFVGALVVTGGLVGRRRALVPIGLTLLGWGTAVLLVRDGPLPANRTAPAYLVGVAVGLLAAHLLTRAWNISLTGSILTALNAGLAFYLAYDFDAIGDWPLWAAVLAAWGVVELVRPPAKR